MAKYGAQDRRDLANKGHALPDGSFPIADVEDLKSAIRNWALGKQPDVAKRFIIKRARALGASDVIPSKWLHPEIVQHTDTVDEFLAHYGVKGMRWGVTTVKDKAATDVVSKADRKLGKSNYLKYGEHILEERLDRQFGGKLNYSELSTKPVTIAKGKKFYRFTNHKDESMRDITYVSTNDADRLRYKVALGRGSGLSTLSIAPKKYTLSYEATYKATKALSSPSEKERVDAFVNLVDADIPVGRGSRTMKGRIVLKKAGYDAKLARVDKQRFAEENYYRFASEQFAKTPLNTAYFNSLRAKGYNALVDDNDRNIVSKDPLIILDTKGAIKGMSVRQLTNGEMNEALKTFTSVQSERPGFKQKS